MSLSADDDCGRRAFLDWARACKRPLSFNSTRLQIGDLKAALGDSRIIALSEPVHCSHEPLELRNALAMDLADEPNGLVVALESGVVESRHVHDHVAGRTADEERALSEGLTWNFDRLPENRALLRRLREVNSSRGQSHVSLYGFDMSGSPGNSRCRHDVSTALKQSLAFLATLDRACAERFRARLGRLVDNLAFSLEEGARDRGYWSLDDRQRDRLTAVICDMVTLVERNQLRYIDRIEPADYDWGHRACLAARQCDSWLRQFTRLHRDARAASRDFDEQTHGFIAAALDVRDRAQVDNLGWIVGRENQARRFLVYASRYHLVGSLLRFENPKIAANTQQHVTGAYLKRRFGAGLVHVMVCMANGRSRCGPYQEEHSLPATGSFDHLIGEVDRSIFFIDLRSAPPAIRSYLAREMPLGHPESFHISPIHACDIAVYFPSVSAPRAVASVANGTSGHD